MTRGRLPAVGTLLFFGYILAVSLLRLFITLDQPLFAIEARFDDGLFFGQALSISEGHWLGRYHHLTLSKGPFFPIYAAYMNLLGVPLILSFHFLSLTAAALFCIATHPITKRLSVSALLYTLIIYNPYSMMGELQTRFLRDSIYPSLSLLAVSAALGYFLNSFFSKRNTKYFAMLTGLLFSVFSLTREEGIWLAPLVGLMYAGGTFSIFMHSVYSKRDKIFLIISPLLCVVFVQVFIGLLNTRYKRFVLVETQAQAFSDAYGALLRIRHEHWRKFVVVPKDVRMKAYEVSPTYAKIKPFQEGAIGEDDVKTSCRELNICDDIAGGWFIWSFLDSINAAGIANNARSTHNFFTDMAKEINAACDEKKLDCLPFRSGLLPPLRKEYLAPFIKIFPSLIFLSLRFDNSGLKTPDSFGSKIFLEQISRFTKTQLSSAQFEYPHLDVKNALLTGIANLYRLTILPLLLISLVIFCLQVIVYLVWRKGGAAILCSLGLLGAMLARVTIFTLIDISSYPAGQLRYMTPIMPLMLCFIGLSITFAITLIYKMIKGRTVDAF